MKFCKLTHHFGGPVPMGPWHSSTLQPWLWGWGPLLYCILIATLKQLPFQIAANIQKLQNCISAPKNCPGRPTFNCSPVLSFVSILNLHKMENCNSKYIYLYACNVQSYCYSSYFIKKIGTCFCPEIYQITYLKVYIFNFHSSQTTEFKIICPRYRP